MYQHQLHMLLSYPDGKSEVQVNRIRAAMKNLTDDFEAKYRKSEVME